MSTRVYRIASDPSPLRALPNLTQCTHGNPHATSSISRPLSEVSDPVIVHSRMELLASDMITRALVLTISRSLPPNPDYNRSGTLRNWRELLTLSAVCAMQAMLQDLAVLSEVLDENVELFADDQRNLGAQQKSWMGHSATERLFWTTDNSIELVSRSTGWVAHD
ncbi:hypothetical protein C8R45DRAFT_1115727 [Mycena sanguinolenta]|nr:hypothetical protein C8R45DRAFT_1115727 [Mycena sanguinolenta]